MPTYVQATTESGSELFPNCGGKEIAGNVSNLGEAAGANYSLAYSANISLATPFSTQAHSKNRTNPQYVIDIVVPNYEPIQSMLLNMMAENDVVSKLVISNTMRKPGNTVSIRQVSEYTAENGTLVSYDGDMSANATGSITMEFVFEKLHHENKLTNTSGSISTVAS